MIQTGNRNGFTCYRQADKVLRHRKYGLHPVSSLSFGSDHHDLIAPNKRSSRPQEADLKWTDNSLRRDKHLSHERASQLSHEDLRSALDTPCTGAINILTTFHLFEASRHGVCRRRNIIRLRSREILSHQARDHTWPLLHSHGQAWVRTDIDYVALQRSDVREVKGFESVQSNSPSIGAPSRFSKLAQPMLLVERRRRSRKSHLLLHTQSTAAASTCAGQNTSSILRPEDNPSTALCLSLLDHPCLSTPIGHRTVPLGSRTLV